MIRFCELSRMKIRLQDTSLPHFSKTLHSLYLILSWKGIVKSNTKFNNNLRRGLVFLCVYFLSSFFHSKHPKKRGRESRVLKTSIIVRRKYITHTIGNKGDHNKALLKFWRESDEGPILFFKKKKKKNVRNGTDSAKSVEGVIVRECMTKMVCMTYEQTSSHARSYCR